MQNKRTHKHDLVKVSDPFIPENGLMAVEILTDPANGHTFAIPTMSVSTFNELKGGGERENEDLLSDLFEEYLIDGPNAKNNAQVYVKKKSVLDGHDWKSYGRQMAKDNERLRAEIVALEAKVEKMEQALKEISELPIQGTTMHLNYLMCAVSLANKAIEQEGEKEPVPQGPATTVLVPCSEDDPRAVGGYTSYDGRSLCHVRESEVPVIEGPVWVKASQFKFEVGIAYHAKDSKSKGAGHFDDFGNFFWNDHNMTPGDSQDDLLILDESEKEVANG